MTKRVWIVGIVPFGIFLQDGEGKFLDAEGCWRGNQPSFQNLHHKTFRSWREAKKYAKEQDWQVDLVGLNILCFLVYKFSSYLEWILHYPKGQWWITIQVVITFLAMVIREDSLVFFILLGLLIFQVIAGITWHCWLRSK